MTTCFKSSNEYIVYSSTICIYTKCIYVYMYVYCW